MLSGNLQATYGNMPSSHHFLYDDVCILIWKCIDKQQIKLKHHYLKIMQIFLEHNTKLWPWYIQKNAFGIIFWLYSEKNE